MVLVDQTTDEEAYGGIFEIVRDDDTNYGVLHVLDRDALDYERTPTYTGEITATDSYGNFKKVFVTITLTDVNEPPQFLASPRDPSSPWAESPGAVPRGHRASPPGSVA